MTTKKIEPLDLPARYKGLTDERRRDLEAALAGKAPELPSDDGRSADDDDIWDAAQRAVTERARDPQKFLADVQKDYGEHNGAVLAFWIVVQSFMRTGEPLPDWVLDRLYTAATEVAKHGRPDSLIFTADRKGRHVNPMIRRREDEKARYIRTALQEGLFIQALIRQSVARYGRLRVVRGHEYAENEDGLTPLTDVALCEAARSRLESIGYNVAPGVLRKALETLRRTPSLPGDDLNRSMLIIEEYFAKRKDEHSRNRQILPRH